MPNHAPPCEAPERSTTRPRFEVADIIRRVVDSGFTDRPLPPEQAAVLRAICRCRTAQLGGHAHVCTEPGCGHVDIAYNSCRNRHCPRCQWAAQERWIASRLERVLDTHYFHVVFTLPEGLKPLAMSSPRELYGLLFQAASQTLLELGRDPKWLGGEVGITMVLHTWTRDLRLHPHVHCLVTGGGLSKDSAWIAAPPKFLIPVHVIGALFRGKFLAGLKSLHRRDKLRLDGPAADLVDGDVFGALLNRLYEKKWVVYAKRPMAGPQQVIKYLGRYTHRVAIANSRLIEVTDDRVVFRTRGDKTATLTPEHFVRRFLLHVLPKRFVKIRHYGLLASPNVPTLWLTAHTQLAEMKAQRTNDRDEHHTSCTTPAPQRRCSACGSEKLVSFEFWPGEHLDIQPPRPRGPPPSLASRIQP